MITADLLVAHAVGDYVLQSDWMASEKVKRSFACACHVATYFLPFLFLTRSLPALAVIIGTHFVIDRWRLARYVCWVKNHLGPIHLTGPLGPDGDEIEFATPPWPECRATGYPPDKPDFLAVWLLIIADNVMHVLCNGAAIWWLS